MPETVSKKVRITVEPPEAHPDVLSVQDALQQAIDFFNVLTDDSNKNVVWNLTLASTNSPFTCEGEPVDLRTMATAYGVMSHRIAVVEHNFERIAHGRDFDESFPRDKLEIAQAILRRTTNGIGAIKTRFSEHTADLSISRATAKRYFEEVLSPAESLHSYLFSRTARREVGSIEGRIVDIGTDYNSPAIQLIEHKSGRKIWCQVSHMAEEQLAEDLKAGYAWGHRRVRVRGTIHHDANGKAMRLVDGVVALVETKQFAIEDIEDRDFTGGYSVSEYLDRLQEDEFGQ